MKKKWQTALSVLLYVFILACALDFNLFVLVDLRLLFLTLVGTLLLTLPYYEAGISRQELLYIFGRKSIDTGFIQTFLLLFARFQNEAGYTRLLGDIALCFRPVLYSFCLFVLLTERAEAQNTEKSDCGDQAVIRSDQSKSNTLESDIVQSDTLESDKVLYGAQTSGEQKNVSYESAAQTTSETETTVFETGTSTRQVPAPKKLGIHEFAVTYALTRRETEITQLIIQGKSNAMIAEALFISETTVKKHVSNIFDKTGVNRRDELIVRVRED